MAATDPHTAELAAMKPCRAPTAHRTRSARGGENRPHAQKEVLAWVTDMRGILSPRNVRAVPL